MKTIRKFLITVLILSLSFNLFSEEKKSDAEISLTEQIFLDARRFEIITLGSLPFVTMDYSLVYSAIYKGKKDGIDSISPFLSLTYKPSSENLSGSEKWNEFWDSNAGQVIIGSVISSAIVGVADLGIRIVKRNITTSRRLKNAQKNIVISDLENDPDAIKLPVYDQNDSNDEVIIIEE